MYSLVPRPSPAPVFDHLQQSKTGAGEGLETRLVMSAPIANAPHNLDGDAALKVKRKFDIAYMLLSKT